MPDLPGWASWNPAASEHPWTVGVEEEVALVDGRTLGVVNRIEDVLAAVTRPLRSRTSAETHACVAEVKTAPHATVPALAAELMTLRARLHDQVGARLGLALVAAGTHPLAERAEVTVSTDPRHREIEDTMRVLARREPTMALHVHVAVPDLATGVTVLDGLRDELPLLLALSANSPFWRGRDSGFASMRIPLLAMFPRMGTAEAFGSPARYVEVVDRLVRSGAIPDPSFLWWDARLQPRIGTVEVRIMDAQSHIADVAALAALVQCRVRHHATRRTPAAAATEEVAENRFLAARDGPGAQLIDRATGARRWAHDVVGELLEDSQPHAAELGCVPELEEVERLADAPGATRQRETAARRGIGAVVADLAATYLAGPPATLTTAGVP
jgi:glutamate---cysteine ligase / carboxylate-amine ligase